jgi:hypothetical protein
LKYAEILYTIGGIDNYRTARKYFAQSVELNPNQNLRHFLIKSRPFFAACAAHPAGMRSAKCEPRSALMCAPFGWACSALYGLWLSCVAIASCKASAEGAAENAKLLAWSGDLLVGSYRDSKNRLMADYVSKLRAQVAA